ncbi:MAG: aspartate aminotransferase family protein [Frankiales bacterium]|nr:aspartate aminotransferase family protein [Frankiales bacterium]
MTARPDAYTAALQAAHDHALQWLESQQTRKVPPRATVDELLPLLGGPLPDVPTDPAEVVELLAKEAEAGLMAIPSGRFFGWVIGGTLPAALAADWLVSAWDQNAGLRAITPAAAAVEQIAAGWLLDVLGLPETADVGFVTGATMANFTCLAAARQAALMKAGWDLDRNGLNGAPPLQLLVGAERHETVDLALRYLGLGAPTVVAVDDQGRILPAALEAALRPGPAIVCLQAGNIHSGAFDPVAECVESVHRYGGWVHVDGAFGLWAAASPSLRQRVPGLEHADSWATDAHKTLNVPYDSGLAIVADRAAVRGAMGLHASYLIHDEAGDPFEKVPELSRRARGVPVWAALRSLGRQGVTDLVDQLALRARQLADGLGQVPGATVVNDVVFTQVSVSFGDDETTRAVTAELLRDGTAWMSGSVWRGQAVLRVSVSNWSTDEADVATSVDAVARASARVRTGGAP